MVELKLEWEDLYDYIEIVVTGICLYNIKTEDDIQIKLSPEIKCQLRDPPCFTYPSLCNIPIEQFIQTQHSFNLVLINDVECIYNLENVIGSIDYIWGVIQKKEVNNAIKWLQAHSSLESKIICEGEDKVECFFAKDKVNSILPKDIDQEKLNKIFSNHKKDIFDDVVFVNTKSDKYDKNRINNLFNDKMGITTTKETKKEEEIVFVKPSFGNEHIDHKYKSRVLKQIDMKRINDMFKNSV